MPIVSMNEICFAVKKHTQDYELHQMWTSHLGVNHSVLARTKSSCPSLIHTNSHSIVMVRKRGVNVAFNGIHYGFSPPQLWPVQPRICCSVFDCLDSRPAAQTHAKTWLWWSTILFSTLLLCCFQIFQTIDAN